VLHAAPDTRRMGRTDEAQTALGRQLWGEHVEALLRRPDVAEIAEPR
jgi:hypothetical protein